MANTLFKAVVGFLEDRRLLKAHKRALASIANHIPESRYGPITRIAVVPGDPGTVTGSKGDEAMLETVIRYLRAIDPDIDIGVVTGNPQAEQVVQRMGLHPLPVWHLREIEPCLMRLDAFKPDALWVLGADVIDGAYDAVDADRMVMLASIYAQRRRSGAILGFSFNSAPSSRVVNTLRAASTQLHLRVRDPRSWKRIRQFTGLKPKLVADLAFMLKPDALSTRLAATTAWVAQQKSLGHAVLGFNLHPMLIQGGDPVQLNALKATALDALARMLSTHKLSLVFISHDHRSAVGDHLCLAPIHAELARHFSDRIHLPEQALSAAQLKALAGEMDGVVTGRMHLAIASLGMGVPVLGLGYQDKFEGLFDQFHLPPELLLQPTTLRHNDDLHRSLVHFLQCLPELRASVKAHLPKVEKLARQNFHNIW